MNIKLWLPLVFYITSCRFSTKRLWDINVFWDQPYHRSSSRAFMQGKNKYSFEQHWLLSHLLSVVFSAAINKVNVYANETFSVLSWDIYLAGGHCTNFMHLIQTAAFCCWNVRRLSNSYFPRTRCWTKNKIKATHILPWSRKWFELNLRNKRLFLTSYLYLLWSVCDEESCFH